jgi:hypothetical protein
MSSNTNTFRNLGYILFAIGIIMGLVLQGGALWADFEAGMFDVTLPANWADTELTTVSCPIVISSQEVGTVTASFTNDTEKDINLRIRVHVTDGLVTLLREENTTLPILTGATQQAEWVVFPEDAAWQHFILVRVFQFRAYKIPSRSASCGILLVDLFNLTGNQLLIFLGTISLLGMISGLAIFIYLNRPLKGRNLSIGVALSILVILVVAGTVTSFSGLVVVGGGFLLVTVLLLLSLLPFAFRVQQI